ncbi:MAG: ATP-binding protein [Anaerolineae bacterium]|nr:ATP-binding protein [Anaerolineae bacterium]
MADPIPVSLKNFFQDTRRLLQWSLLQPGKVTAYQQAVHPALAHHAGLCRQLALALRRSEARRFLGMQISLWFSAGLLGSFLLILIRDIPNLPALPTWPDIALGLALGLAGGVVLGLAGTMAGDVAYGVTLSFVGGILLGITMGLAFVVALGGVMFSLALALTSGIAIGAASSLFDHLRQRMFDLWTFNYWGRAIVGVIYSAVIVVALIALVLIIGLTGSTEFSLETQVTIGVAIGLLGGLALSLAFGLEMLIEQRRLSAGSLKWIIVDCLLLGLIGGAAGALTVGVTTVVNTVTLIVLWAVLAAAGGALSMRVGNGLSALLAVAGLAWLFSASLSDPLALNSLLLVVIALLIGFYGYVRLLVYPLEALLSWWAYRQARRDPTQSLSRLRRTPVYWDDLIFYPLPMLDQLLLLALRINRSQGLQEARFIAGSFRQDWAATQARLMYAVKTLTNCTSPAMIASAPQELDWLADEVMVTLEQGTHEIVPRLLAIAGGVRVTLSADNLYSRRLGYREALDGLDMLRRRLPSLGQPAGQHWLPVIDQWQQILLNQLEAISANAEVATAIENPYQPGTPLQLSRQELFKGRRELRDAVVNALLERHRPTLVLHGPRRMGKTSFLLQLSALLPGNTLPVFLDLQRPTATQSTAAFLYSITRAISRDARPYRLIVGLPQRTDFDASPFEAFAEWLEDVALPALQDFNLLLTFDEFEKLGEAVESDRIGEQVFDELRYLIQHQTRLALLFAGVQTLDELGPAWSSYFINVKPLTIGYLRPDEAEELIRQPDLQADFKLVYADEVVIEIMTQTHCHPYLLQLVCSAVVEEGNARSTRHIDRRLLEAALLRALDQGEPYFHNIWQEMAGTDGQPFLRQIAAAETPLALPSHPALDRLVRRRILTRTDGDYSVEVPLVRRWLSERAP